MACSGCGDDIELLIDLNMKWLVLDECVATVKQIMGRDIWNRIFHVQQISQQRGLVVIKYFSMYGQFFRRCEYVSNFPKDWEKDMGMDPGAHGESHIIDAE